MGRQAKTPKGTANAPRPSARKAPKNEDSRVRDLEKRLAEALEQLQTRNRELAESQEQQMATGEILRVISCSPNDVQPVFDSIAASALRLCDAKLCTTFRFDGELIHLVASRHVSWEGAAAYREAYPARPGRQGGTHRAILTRTVVHIPDIRHDPEYELRALARANDFGCVLAVPMLRDGHPVGAITVGREAARPFSDEQIALLKTFSDQAVIAIENLRLFTELHEKNDALTKAHAQVTEALEQQTATAEILRVISSSPTDVQPVFDAIARHAARLCDAKFAAVARLDRDLLHFAAHYNYTPEVLEVIGRVFPRPPGPDNLGARSVYERRTVHVADVMSDPEVPESSREVARTLGYRSYLAVPMLREGVALGFIAVNGLGAGFSDEQIRLVETFADQAVIAIENVRLFNETKEALEQQTATSEILRVISGSPGDIQPVFDAIAMNAARLCDAVNGMVIRFDGQLLHLAAHYNVDPERLEAVRRAYPRPPSRGALSGRAVLMRSVVHVPDVSNDPEYTLPAATTIGYRSGLAVPMMHEGVALGTILVARDVVAPFSDAHIALIQTFADQAVIAIENARLFTELQARTQALTRSVEQLTALGDVGRAVSSSLDLDTVLTTIVGRAVQLSGTDGGTIFEYDESAEEFAARATLNADEDQSALLRATRLRRGEGAVGQMAETREPFQIPDIAAEGAYESRIRGAMLASGTRSVLAIPLLHEEQLVGGLVVTRRMPGEFTAEIVELLRTFATQSALAIQNARLFRELEIKSRELEVASQHKSEFLSNMSHELRTPLNAIIGFSDVLLEGMFGEVNEKQTEYLRDILASGQHLLSLINDILDLSKIEAGRMELELSDFDVPTAIENALTLMRERASRHEIKLSRIIDTAVGQIRADERKFKQVLLNLLSNAVKFTSAGGKVEVRASLRDGFVEVAVTDTGEGIAPEDQQAVFEEFRQVGKSSKKAEGTGLGLALCRRFVELHGGMISLASEVGVGSTFTFTVPMRPGLERLHHSMT